MRRTRSLARGEGKMALVLWTFLALSSGVRSVTSQWRPIVPGQGSASILPAHTSTSIIHPESPIYANQPIQASYESQEPHLLLQQAEDQCPLYKISMSQQLYFEYIHYKTDVPDMKEFTLCMWTKFHNHSNDHPLFSYAVGDQSRGILSWVANTARSSYYMMNVDGHNLYRLNYPLRLNKWYHSCQSWNGRTGEWQIWVNDERVGRGFNNRLVGHVIKGGGIAISGQEQRQLGGGFLEGEGAPPGSGGMLGELTMVQLYGIALSAGKAHKDHKHHHAHHHEHETDNIMSITTTQPPVTGPPLPPNPFLTGGQINHRVKINPGAHIQIVQNGVTLRHPALPAPQEPAPQPLPPVNPESIPTAFPALQNYPGDFQGTRFFATPVEPISPAEGGVRFIDGSYRNLFKRDKNLSKRENSGHEVRGTEVNAEVSEKAINKRQADTMSSAEDVSDSASAKSVSDEKNMSKRESDKKKRGLLELSDGLYLDDGYGVSQSLNNNFFSGLASFGQQLPQHETKNEEREPAEAEVRFVMDICDGCSEEPFEKALIFGWRSVPKKIYSGALYLPAAPVCKAF